MTAIEADWGKIILWIVIWVIGYVLGLVEAAVKNKLKAKKSEEEIKLLKAQVDSFQPVQEISEPTSLSVFERETGALELRLDGEMLEHKSDLDSGKRARLLKLVIAIRPWLEVVKTEKKPVPPSVMPTAAQPVASRPVVVSIPEENLASKKLAEEVSFANLSMVEQIDKILQKKLEGTPLAQRGIQLRSSIKGDLRIQVGLNEYKSFDEIPDEAIRQVIHEARDEWNKTAT